MHEASDEDARRSFSRREVLKFGAGGAGLVAGTAALSQLGFSGNGLFGVPAIAKDAVDEAPPRITKFKQELRVPPVLLPSQRLDGVDKYVITMKKAKVQMLPAPMPMTEIWGYNGIAPGPTIIQRRPWAEDPEPVPRTEIRQINALPRPMSVHLHGSPTKPEDDGHPEILIPPGASKSYEYPNGEEARTLWYHDHALHTTAENVYAGLAGMFIQQPSSEDERRFNLAKLPQGYGKYDIPLILCDKIFGRNGQLIYDDQDQRDMFGNVLLVNGVAYPKMTVEPKRYRFRMLCATNSRGFEIAVDKGNFQMIATDSGFLNTPVETNQFRIGMGERYEFIIDFRKFKTGDKITMRNRRTSDDGEISQVMQFVVGPLISEKDTNETPNTLNNIAPLAVSSSVATRKFRFDRSNSQFTINGKTYESGRVDAKPKAGTTEIWELTNSSGGWFHPIHIHLVDFQILDRNGRPPFAYERGWKDVAYVGENETVRVIMKFHPAVDEWGQERLGRYVMHCHNVVHEDHDMMNQFEVVGNGSGALAAAHRSNHMMMDWELT